MDNEEFLLIKKKISLREMQGHVSQHCTVKCTQRKAISYKSQSAIKKNKSF